MGAGMVATFRGQNGSMTTYTNLATTKGLASDSAYAICVHRATYAICVHRALATLHLSAKAERIA